MSPTAPRRLVIMRHAKAESSARSDHARELTDRGRRQSRAAGARMASAGVRPDFVVVSSAARAMSTAAEVLVGLELTTEPETRVLDSLYQADPYDLLSVCALEIEPLAATALVIGHNPTIAGAAHLIQPEGDRVDLSFPTAAFAVFELEGAWTDLGPGIGSLVHAYAPHG
jgi:phosphohistidine phosphatase